MQPLSGPQSQELLDEYAYRANVEHGTPAVDLRGSRAPPPQPLFYPGVAGGGGGAEQFQFEPEVEERIIEIPKLVEQIVEKEVVIPETHIVEVVKEIPQTQEVIREVPRYEFKEVIKEIPRVEVKYIEKKVEVPQVMVRDIPVEVPEVQEVTRMIPRIVVKEVPIERVRRVEKVVYQDVEEIEYVPVPYIVQIQKKKPQGPRGEGLGVDSGGLTPGGVHPGVEGGGPSTSSSSSSGPAGGLTQPGGGGPTAVIASSGLDVNVKVKSEVHLFENVNQVTKPKLVPIEKEVPEYVPQYIDVDVDEYGMPLQPAPSLDVLLARGVPMEVA
mmetsp:Transcript_34/g.63  ORF Transcript_34/g.63 Transcript_34/m.63 type:complete len:327 (-) Transcript_34:264-1244(-)